MNRNSKSQRNCTDVFKRGVPFAALNTSQIGGMHSCTPGELLLGPAVLQSKSSDAAPERPPHWEQALLQNKIPPSIS